jgi:hypothetical protein
MVGEGVRLGKGVKVGAGAVGKRRNGAGLEPGGSGVGVPDRLPGRLQPERMSNSARRISGYRKGIIIRIVPWYAVRRIYRFEGWGSGDEFEAAQIGGGAEKKLREG